MLGAAHESVARAATRTAAKDPVGLRIKRFGDDFGGGGNVERSLISMIEKRPKFDDSESQAGESSAIFGEIMEGAGKTS